ncbi:MAG: hypothetical protein J7M05_01440, partial [Anaerolineae bacterium]|nr:hypothetical protein [Anaerolineae bacterium]
TWIFFSRAAEGVIPSVSLGALFLLACWWYSHSEDRNAARLISLALGFGLAAGSNIYTLLLAFFGGVLGWWVLQRQSPSEREKLQRLWRGWAVRENLLFFVGSFLAAATALSFNLGGLGASAELLGRWLGELWPKGDAGPWFAMPKALFTYEFLTLGLALIGAGVGLRRRSPLEIWLVSWAVLSLLLGTLLGHRSPAWLVDVLLPLVLLAARGFEYLWQEYLEEIDIPDLVAGWVAFVVLVFAALQLAIFLHTAQRVFLSYMRIALGGYLIALAAYWFWRGEKAAWRATILAGGIILVVLTVRTSTAVAYQTARDPREWLVRSPASVQIRDFEHFITTLSSRRAGDPHLLDIEYEEDLGPWMEWYLRAFPNARVLTFPKRPEAEVLITKVWSQQEWPKGYVGQRFRLKEHFPAQELSLREKLRWFLYREPVGTEKASEIEVWVRLSKAQ